MAESGGLRRTDCGTARSRSVGKIWRGFLVPTCFKYASFTLPTELESDIVWTLGGTAIVQSLSGQFDVPSPPSWPHYVRLLTMFIPPDAFGFSELVFAVAIC